MTDPVQRTDPPRAAGTAAPAPKGSPLGSAAPAVARLREVLEKAFADAGTAACRRVLVLTHRGPDPDALGACEGIRRLVKEGFGFDVEVATVGRIHRAENLAMVRELDLELREYYELDPDRFCGALLVDTQPEFGHTVLPKQIPVLAVFDHHVPPPRKAEERKEPADASGNGRATESASQGAETAQSRAERIAAQPSGGGRGGAPKDSPPAIAHQDVRLGVGATSSIIYEYLRDSGVEIDEHTASALFCGVRYDTADLSRNASALDEEAYYETFRRADREAISKIAHPPLPREYYRELAKALGEARQHGALTVALLGRVTNPEFVAEMADFLLRMQGCSWVVVGGSYGDEYVLSLRTDYAFGKAYPLMARVVGDLGTFGGHGHIAGGRIKLEDQGESTIASIERTLRSNALGILGPEDERPEGKALS